MPGPWDTPPTEADRVDAPGTPAPSAGVWGAPPRPEEAVAGEAAPVPAQVTGEELQRTANLVAPVDPDRHAQVVDLSTRTGIPPAVVRADPAGFEKATTAAELQMLPSHAPRTAQWLSDPSNMALAKDDVEALGTIESILQYGPLGALDWQVRKVGGEGDRPLWTAAFRKGLAGLQVALDKTLEQLGADPAASLFVHPWVALRAAFLGTVGAEVEPLEELEAAKRQDAATAARDLGAKSLVAKVWAGTFQALPYLGGALGAGAVAGPPGVVGFGAAATYGETRERLGEIRGPQGQELTPAEKTAIAAPVALGVGAVQALPVTKYLGKPILGRLAPDIFDRILSSTTIPAMIARFAARTSVHAAAGATAMAAGSALEDTAVQLAADGLDPTLPERDPDRWARVTERAWQTFEDGLRDFALISAFGAGRQALHEAGLRAESQRQAAAIVALGDAAKESKLGGRSEGATQEAVAQMAPGSSWLVSREAWDGYWRGKGIDPAAKAAAVAGDQGAAYDASASSGFVAFPTAAYVAKLGKTTHLLALAPDSKWTTDARTASEQARADQADTRMLEEVQKARGGEFEAEKRQVVETIKKAASSVKQVNADEVEAVASLVAENAGSYALRMAIPVAEAVNLMGLRRLRFTGPGGEEAAQLAQADLRNMLSPEAGATLDAARAGDRRALARLEAAAYRDPLTGLLNRTAFVDYRRTRAPGGWDVAIDANDLAAQDVLGGHEVGDAMLTRVAQAMREAADATGVGRLYRWGGDEFHAGSFKSQAEAEAFANAVREKLGAAPEVAKGFRSSVSMGVGPDIASADAALYEAKTQKAAKVGRFVKGRPETITPQLGGGESFVAVREKAEAPAGERFVTEIGGKSVTLEQGGAQRYHQRMRVETFELNPWIFRRNGRWQADFLLSRGDAARGDEYVPYSVNLQKTGKNFFDLDLEDPEQKLAAHLEEALGEAPFEVTFENVRTGYGPQQNKFGLTGTGQARAAIEKVASLVVDAVHRFEPSAMYFSAAEASRRRLYMSLTRQISAFAPYSGFVLSEAGGDPRLYFVLVSNDKIEPFMRAVEKSGRQATELGLEAGSRRAPKSESDRKLRMEQDSRGVIRMRLDATGRPVDFPVELFAGADVSTLAHEVGGHFLSWAMHDVSADPRATSGIRSDYEALLKWAGYGSAEQRLQEGLERADLESRASLGPADEGRLKALRAKEERIGHGFEQYLAEGKAPSAALARTFARMRSWLVRIYRSLFGIGEQYRREYGQDLALSDEVRAVFDRWFAAEREVRNQDAEGTSDAYLAALDPADRAAVLRARQDRRIEAETAAYQTLTQAEKGATEDVRASVRKEILGHAEQEPVYRLRQYLTRPSAPEAGIVEAALGRLDPALLDEHGRPWKLSRPAVEAIYGPEIVKRLPRGSTVKEGGIDPEILAEKFGFADAPEMIRALAEAPALEKAVEARLDQRMRDLFPSAAEDPRGVVEAAVEAEHSPRAAEEALLGARILVRRVVPEMADRLRVMEDVKARNRQAERIVAGMRIADLSPEAILARERAEARMAQEFTAKALGGDTPQRKEFAALAMDHRDAQLLDMALYRAIRDARAEAEQAQTKAKRRTTDEYRRRLGKVVSYGEGGEVSQPYLDRMDDLLGRIDWRQSGKQAGAASRFLDWVKEQPADKQQDILAGIPEKFIASLDKAQHWTDLTVQEMRDLVQAMDVIDAQARLKAKLRLAGEERDFEGVVQEIVRGVRERFPAGGGVARLERVQPLGRRLLTRPAQVLKATLARPEELYRELGPQAYEAVWRPLSEAADQWSKVMTEVGKPIVQEIDRLARKDRTFFRKRFEIDGQLLDGEAVIAMALNAGSRSNLDKMQRGEVVLSGRFAKAQPIQMATIEKALSRMTAAHVDLVNRIHRQVSAKWDEIAALEKEFTGLAPPKIEALPRDITLADGTKAHLDGGYYPIVFDPRFSTAGQRAGEQVSQGVGALAFASNYERAVTPQGHLQARIESFARPLDLSLASLARTVANHTRDLAMRRALVQTREVLTDGRVRDAIQEAMGDDAYRALLDHWRDTANQYALPRGQPDWMLRWLSARRTAFSAGVLAGNLPLAIQNFANVAPAISEIPAARLASASVRFAVERLDLVDRIYGRSEYMRQRAAEFDQSISRATAGLVGRQGTTALYADEVRRLAMWTMESTDLATRIPVWWAAYEHGLSPKGEGARGMEEAGSRATGLGLAETEAVAYADRVVRLTQSSYRWLDKSGFERHPLFKHFTYFYGYLSSQLSRFFAVHADARVLNREAGRAEMIRRVAKGFGFLMASGILAEALVGNGPDDYDGDGEISGADWARWIATTGGTYPGATLPIIGSAVRQLGDKSPSRDVSLTPWIRGGQTLHRAWAAASKIGGEEATGAEEWQAAMLSLEALGWYYGLPVVQMRRTGDFLWDITPDGIQMTEEAAGASLPEAAWKTVYGKGRPGRLSEALWGPGPGR